MKQTVAKEWCIDLLIYVAGAVLFGVAMQMFIVPNQISPGGVSGVAVVLNYTVGGPVGLWTFVMNIPIMLLAWKFLGKVFLIKTLTALVIYSLITDGLYYVLPPYPVDPLLAALFAGALMGIGFAMLFMRGSTSGGVDVISRLIQLKYPHVSMGRLLLTLDVVIIVSAALVFRDPETVLYSIVTVFVSTKTIDSILYGMDRGKLVYIMTQADPDKISSRIIAEMNRSCTILNATGAYTKQPVYALLVAVRVQQFHQLKRIADEEDPKSFVIVTDATQVFGIGFAS